MHLTGAAVRLYLHLQHRSSQPQGEPASCSRLILNQLFESLEPTGPSALTALPMHPRGCQHPPARAVPLSAKPLCFIFRHARPDKFNGPQNCTAPPLASPTLPPIAPPIAQPAAESVDCSITQLDPPCISTPVLPSCVIYYFHTRLRSPWLDVGRGIPEVPL